MRRCAKIRTMGIHVSVKQLTLHRYGSLHGMLSLRLGVMLHLPVPESLFLKINMYYAYLSHSFHNTKWLVGCVSWLCGAIQCCVIYYYNLVSNLPLGWMRMIRSKSTLYTVYYVFREKVSKKFMELGQKPYNFWPAFSSVLIIQAKWATAL